MLIHRKFLIFVHVQEIAKHKAPHSVVVSRMGLLDLQGWWRGARQEFT
jgi:hypothetical protein